MRHRSYHGPTRGQQAVDEADAITKVLDDPNLDDCTEEEIGTLLRDMTTTLSSKREIRYEEFYIIHCVLILTLILYIYTYIYIYMYIYMCKSFLNFDIEMVAMVKYYLHPV